MRLQPAGSLSILAVLAVVSGCTGAARPEVASSSVDAISVDSMRSALLSEWVHIEHEAVSTTPSELVLLIGENHASVLAQENLARLLERLVEKRLIDVVLIEGSNGPIETKSQDLIPAGLSASEFWLGRLRWGQLAGYEYVTLNNPTLPVYGVEDMAAKLRFQITEVTAVSQSRLDDIVDVPRRGKAEVELAESRLREQRPGEDYNDLDDAIRRLGTSVDSLAARSTALARAQQPSVQTQLELLKVSNEAQDLLGQIGPDLDQAQQHESEFNVLLPKYKQEVERYNELVSSARLLGGLTVSVQLSRLKASIEEKQSRLEKLKSQLETFEGKHGSRLKRLGALIKNQGELKSRLDSAVERFTGQGTAFQKANEHAIDRYFHAANQLRRRIQASWNNGQPPLPVRAALESVDRFFDREAQRIKVKSEVNGPERLLERDRAMSANTAAYLKQSGHRRVALIVGYAHLPGMIKQLQDRHISYISAALRGNDSHEPWESIAWEHRTSPQAVLTRQPATIKELSLLLNKLWRLETAATFNLLREVHVVNGAGEIRKPSLAGAVRVYDNIGATGDKVMLVSKHLPGPKASLSAHVLSRGPVPDSPAQIFQVLDRNLAGKAVRDNTDQVAEFMYLFRRPQDGIPQYRVITAAGELAPSELARATTGRSPRYRVVEVEPDFNEESGTVVSPGGRAIALAGASDGGGRGRPPTDGLRSGAKGDRPGRPEPPLDDDPPPSTGGGGEPPKNPFSPLFVADGGDRRRVGVFLTTDMQRAKQNMKKLRNQKPLEHKDMTFSEEPRSLIDMPFATSDGEGAGLVVLLARNTKEFRAAVEEASAARKLTNKQVVLITCGDAFVETAELRESILQGGAILVWSPQRQLTPEAGRQLQQRAAELLRGNRYRDVDHLMRRVVESLRSDDAVAGPLRDAVSYTD